VAHVNVSPESVRLPGWVRAINAATLLLIVLALAVTVNGGSRVQVGGLLLSVRSAGRVWVWAAALALLRNARKPCAPRFGPSS